MMNIVSSTIAWPANPVHVPLKTLRGAVVEIVLIALAVGLPAVAHALSWPVFALLPMHWTILLAGLVYGWKGGLLAGFSSPIVSFALTGMPVAFMLPVIVVEVSLYGVISGLFSKNNAFIAVFIALIAGRIGFGMSALLLGRVEGSLASFIVSSFGPGLAAAGAQLVALPFVAGAVFTYLNKGR